MLPYLFAIAIAVASLSLFFTAFFSPNWHRKDDFLWSGVGLIYALVLWICAEQIRGSVLLGQAAATTLVLSLIWQTVQLRKLLAVSDKRTELTALSFTAALERFWAKKKKGIKPNTGGANLSVPENIQPKVEDLAAAIAQVPEKSSVLIENIENTVENIVDKTKDVPEIKDLTETVGKAPKIDEVIDNIDPKNALEDIEDIISTDTFSGSDLLDPKVPNKNSTSSPIAVTTKPQKRGFSLTSLFGRNKPQTDNIPNLQPEALTELLDRQDEDINSQKDAEWDNVAQESLETVVLPSQPDEDADWDDIFESSTPETQIEEIKEAVTEAVTEAIAPLQEQVESLLDHTSAVTTAITEETLPIAEPISDIPAKFETEGNAFLEQLKDETEAVKENSDLET
jgi:hypothetical protein